jgi:lipoprotein-releasing system permease protein
VTMALIISLVATVYPAWHAARMDPAESLKYE